MQKDVFRAGTAGPTGGNQVQGKGEMASKVSVPMPGVNATQKPYSKQGKSCGPVDGFSGGLINGKV
jgi:hypothetical protein